MRARARLDEVQPVPVRARLLGLGGEDLHRVAVVEGRLQRDEAAVDPGADGAVADVGVDRVGEVDRGGAVREGDDLAARREDEDLGAGQVVAERVEELGRVLGLALPVDELAQPGHLGGVLARLDLGLAARLVGLPLARTGPWACMSSLYFQCAATPYSARLCMPQVRICSSTGLPPGPMTVVCSDWYMLNFGIAM